MENREQIAGMAVEFWKLIRSYERSLPLLPPDHQAKTRAQVRFSETRLKSLLDEVDFTLVTFEGKPFEPNLPVTAVNVEDFAEDVGCLLIEQTIEPAIVHDANVLFMGKVVLKKGGKHVSGN